MTDEERRSGEPNDAEEMRRILRILLETDKAAEVRAMINDCFQQAVAAGEIDISGPVPVAKR
jgi:hypothetical protein